MIDHVVSLGSQCITTGLIAHFGYKKWSGPLDWIYSTPAMVAHCIADRFSDLLDAEQYGEIDGRVDHLAFRRRYGRDAVFGHHADRARYSRAAQRFNTIMTDNTHKLGVVISEANILTGDGTELIASALQTNTRNTRLLAIRVGSHTKPFQVRVDRDDTLAKVVYFNPTTPIGGMGFGSDQDNEAIGHLIASCI